MNTISMINIKIGLELYIYIFNKIYNCLIVFVNMGFKLPGFLLKGLLFYNVNVDTRADAKALCVHRAINVY